MSDYAAFLEQKRQLGGDHGFKPTFLPDFLFPFQRALVEWACRKGRAAIFADCGLGKTAMQLAWARNVSTMSGGKVLVLAPLAVSKQTEGEARKFGIPGVVCARTHDEAGDVTVTNYEKMDRFDLCDFAGIVLDESSILKSYDGATRNAILAAFVETPFRLACTATPAPNDYMELGNHAEFVGSMTRTEMLSMFFVHDGGETQKWRLKGHAVEPFWKWVCSWAVMLKKPSDIGFSDGGFDLPPLEYVEHVVPADPMQAGFLFDFASGDVHARRAARRASIAERVARAAALVASEPDEKWLVWCDLNAESAALVSAIPGAVEVTGSDDPETKSERLSAFADGNIRVLVSKPSIAGWGMNFQSCRRMVFVGLSDSYESLYQATRRCWRFGQDHPVVAHIVTAETEGAVLANVKRKEADAEAMASNMVNHMSKIEIEEIRGTSHVTSSYEEDRSSDSDWTMVLGDCVKVVSEMPDESIDYSIFSPPFASLYTYSNSGRDMGNCETHEEFFQHFLFLVDELSRVVKPGRLVSFHCMNLPTSKVRDGVIGLRDFRGELIRAFSERGWVYHSEVCIWKDPVTAMQRTKALGLLHKQLKKDSCMSRQGIPDYLVTMRRPGENAAPVEHDNSTFPVSEWQKIASPIWMDINPNDTLQYRSARDHDDERHICPLQLEVIRRGIRLWSRPGDLVLSPFAGIGSEGYVALESGRRFFGVELKRSYFDQAVKNLRQAVEARAQQELFS